MAYDDLKVQPAKELIQVITIHLEKCGLVFSSTNGLGTCTATGEPCHQGWATCRDQVNYVAEDFPISLCTPTPNLPPGMLPFLKDVRHEPTEPDPEQSMGKRSVLRATFRDAPHDDVGIDPYIASRSYNALQRSTFWPKLRARFPYYQGRVVEYHYGYNHTPFNLANLKRRVALIEDFAGWGTGQDPQLVAKDPLKFLDDERIVYPAKSVGTLASGMDASSALTQIDIFTENLDEYDLETFEPVGVVRVGNECFTYATVDKVSVTGGVRLAGASRSIPAPYETVKESHSAGDLVQKCPYFYQMRPSEIYEFFIVTVGGQDPSYVNSAEWLEENDTWLAGLRLTRIVAEPQGVTSHINEIIPQAGTWAIWFDEEAAQHRYRVNRPIDIDENVLAFNDAANNVAQSVGVEDENKRLVNEVYIAFGQRDPTKKLDEASNYRTGVSTLRTSSQSRREHGQKRIKTIFARWSPAVNKPELIIIADRILASRSTVPVRIEFDIEAKDDSLKLADFLDLTSMALVDAFGAERQNVRFRVIKAKQGEKGLSVAAREEFFSPDFGRWAPDTFPAGYTYAEATEDERRRYLFWSDADGKLGLNIGKAWL